MATIWPRLQGNYTQMDYSGRSRKVTLEDQIKKVSSAGHVYSFFFRVRVNFFQTLYLTILCFPTFFLTHLNLIFSQHQKNSLRNMVRNMFTNKLKVMYMNSSLILVGEGGHIIGRRMARTNRF